MSGAAGGPEQAPAPGQWAAVVVAWLVVGIPLAWGVLSTARKAMQLFR